jgi:DNA-binding NarL/FixJ family response regulator
MAPEFYCPFPLFVVQCVRPPLDDAIACLIYFGRNMDTRILIADRQDMFREVLRGLLASQPDFAVVADTDDGEQLPHLVSDHQPDVLLMDLKLHKRFGLDVLREIAARHADVRPIVLTEAIAQSLIVQALLWGARGVVQKNVSTNLLFHSIRMVMAGEYWIGHSGVAELVRRLRSMAALAEQSTQSQARTLSPQQRQIVEAIVSGYSNRDIAKELRVSERTVKYHLTRIFSKFGVSGRMELARYSLKHKVIREA